MRVAGFEARGRTGRLVAEELRRAGHTGVAASSTWRARGRHPNLVRTVVEATEDESLVACVPFVSN